MNILDVIKADNVKEFINYIPKSYDKQLISELLQECIDRRASECIGEILSIFKLNIIKAFMEPNVFSDQIIRGIIVNGYFHDSLYPVIEEVTSNIKKGFLIEDHYQCLKRLCEFTEDSGVILSLIENDSVRDKLSLMM